MRSIRFAAAMAAATVMFGLFSAQASPIGYTYAMTGWGPGGGTLAFSLDNAPVNGNNIFALTPGTFDIHYDGLDFTRLDGTLWRLDFWNGDLVNLIYTDSLAHLTFATAGRGYFYSNTQDRRDIHAGAGLFIGGDPPVRAPEPASVATMLAGLLGAGFLFARRGRFSVRARRDSC